MDKCRAFDIWLDKRLCEMDAIGLDEAFYAGWQSRQAEVDELNQLYLKAQYQEIRHRTIAQDALALVEEKDKRIEEIENKLFNLSSMYSTKAAEFNLDNEQELATVCNEISQSLEDLRGEHE